MKYWNTSQKGRLRAAKILLFNDTNFYMLMVFVMTPYPGIPPKNRRSQRKSIPKGEGNSPKSGDDRIGQVFAYVIGFNRVSAGCRNDDRVGPKGGRRWSAIIYFLNIFFSNF